MRLQHSYDDEYLRVVCRFVPVVALRNAILGYATTAVCVLLQLSTIYLLVYLSGPLVRKWVVRS